MSEGEQASDLVGHRVGPYQIDAMIGAGAMGEVYRAHDTRLGRIVAIKVLPRAFMADPDRRARFEREARVLASLNHPNIGAIHGFEDEGGISALALEFVDGETLSERVRRGAPSLDEVLRLTAQLIDALEAAHARGVVHRDLKPSNIMIRSDGVVKVLDFGLAKLAARGGAADPSDATTMVSGSREGLIVGTAAYMSPEQARGQAVDKRTDIWAFGCVLFELLAGCATFERGTIADTLAAVVDREPDWTALPTRLPAAVTRLLRRCLEKDPKRRLHDIADARIELEEAASAGAASSLSPVRPEASRRRFVRAFAAAAGMVAIVALAGLVARVLLRGPAPTPASVRLSVSSPGILTPQTSVAVSPDGTRVSFVSTDASGRSMLWIRELDSLEPRVVPGTDDAAHPFWSPDGASLGFEAGGKLKRVNVDGSGLLTLADVTIRTGATWNQYGDILFNPRIGEFAVVPAAGGAVRTVLERDGANWPAFLPDGTHYLFAVVRGDASERGLYVGSLDSTNATRLVATDFKGAYADPGYLLFVRGEALMAQPFDAERLTLSGDPQLVAEGLWVFRGAGQASFSVSRNGVLAYVNSSLFNIQLHWMSRTGRSLGSLAPPDRYAPRPEISPDGARVAIARGTNIDSSVWALNAGDGSASRLTLESGTNVQPVWSSDGRRLLFSTNSRVMVKAADGTGMDATVVDMAEGLHLWDWSPDSSEIVVGRVGPQGAADLWVWPVDPASPPFPIAQSRFHKTQAQISPDGRWIAYTSYESGRDEIYVQSFPAPGSRRQVSPDGGMQPRWRPDGRELFYVRGDQQMMALPVRTDQGFDAGRPIALFRSRIIPQGSQSIWFDEAYDVTPDGDRFLFTGAADEPSPPITVVLNYLSALAK